MGYQRGSYAIGYVDDMREPLDWLYDTPAFISDFYKVTPPRRSQAAQDDRELCPGYGAPAQTK